MPRPPAPAYAGYFSGKGHVTGNLTTNGSIGIGTTTPAEKLHIFNSSGNALIRLDGGANGLSGVGIQENGAARWTMLFRQWQSDNLVFKDEVGATDILTLQSGTGRVGIGTSTPTTNLEVNGGAKVTGDLSVGSTVSITAATRYLTLCGCDFRVMVSGLAYSGHFALSGDSSNTSYFFAGPVHLPAGAVITEVRAWLVDNHATNDMSVKLQRAVAGNPGVGEDMASLTSSGASASTREFSTTTISNATVENQNYAYLVRLGWTTGADPGQFAFCRVRIAYTVSSLGG